MIPQHDSQLFTEVGLRVKTDYRGELVAVQVTRSGRTLSYERTNRRAHAIFDTPDAELGDFFNSSRAFAKAIQGARVLDLGCGGGGFVRDLRTLGLSAWGLDLVLDSSCRKSQGYVCGDAYDPPFARESFDCITSIYSVFHYEPLSGIPALTERCLDLLTPGGRLLINAPRNRETRNTLVREAQTYGASVFESMKDGALQIIKSSSRRS